MTHYDAIIIGSGQGGTPLAKKLASRGWKTALIEKSVPGGTCVNVGCTPTKAMVASAKTAYMLQQARQLGVEVQGYQVNFNEVMKRKSDIVTQFRSGTEKGIGNTDNLDYIQGTASFTGPKQLKVSRQDNEPLELTARKIFIDAGARPTIPDIDGLDKVDFLTSDSILDLVVLPEHLLIIGGGYIALEFGQMFRRFGSKVTIVEHNERFLEKEDPDISSEVRKVLEMEDICIMTDTQVRSVYANGEVTNVEVDENGIIKQLQCSHVLVAAGRTPNSDLLHLEAAGIETTKHGHIKVDELLTTTAPDVYALGDIKGGPQFTHISYNDYVIVAENILDGGKASTTGRQVPYCMFTDPQLGRIGITETEAHDKGLDVKIACMPASSVARAIETGDTRGLIKAVVDAATGQVLGAAVLCQEGGEIMTVIQMAMTGKIPCTLLRKITIAHPLYAELLNNLFAKI